VVAASGGLITALGVCGHVAQGAVLLAARVCIILATYSRDPAKATGLNRAIKALGEARFGEAVLIAAATGFAAYGVYSFALMRYLRM
jgi:uncharacterized protein DUF1206